MSAKTRFIVLGLVVTGAVIAGGALLANPVESSAAAGDTCCFTNPRFTGVCTVTLSGDESCSSVLGYLNNPNSSGKPYCGGTTIRGGWQLVDCE
jgi:hypothetical protein